MKKIYSIHLYITDIFSFITLCCVFHYTFISQYCFFIKFTIFMIFLFGECIFYEFLLMQSDNLLTYMTL